MELLELLNLANQGYPDGYLENYYDFIDGTFNPEGRGDTFAEAIVLNLIETYDPDAETDTQIQEAVNVLTRVRDDLDEVMGHLLERQYAAA